MLSKHSLAVALLPLSRGRAAQVHSTLLFIGASKDSLTTVNELALVKALGFQTRNFAHAKPHGNLPPLPPSPRSHAFSLVDPYGMVTLCRSYSANTVIYDTKALSFT